MIQKGSRKKMDTSAAQLRAARGLLGWSQTRIGPAIGFVIADRQTELRVDFGIRRFGTMHAQELRHALEAAGVEFIDENGGGAGVRLRKRT